MNETSLAIVLAAYFLLARYYTYFYADYLTQTRCGSKKRNYSKESVLDSNAKKLLQIKSHPLFWPEMKIEIVSVTDFKSCLRFSDALFHLTYTSSQNRNFLDEPVAKRSHCS